jgi:Zn-dependent M16 (insulinase) family peptidase
MQKLFDVRQKISMPGYLESLMDQYFFQNQHVLDFVVSPDSNHGEKLAQSENKRLHSLISNLSELDVENIKKQTIQLAELQNQKEDLGCLPCLTLNDIPSKPEEYPIDEKSILCEKTGRQLSTTYRKTNTNGVSYVKIKFDVSSLNVEQVKMLPLLAASLTGLGTKSLSLADFDESIRTMGALSATCSAYADPSDNQICQSNIMIRAHCIDENIPLMYDKLKEIIGDINWEAESEFYTLLQGELAILSSSIIESGHTFAARAAAAGVSSASYRAELFHGLEQIKYLESLKSEKPLEVLGKLQALAQLVFSQKCSAFVVSEEKTSGIHDQFLKKLVAHFPAQKLHPRADDFKVNYEPLSHSIDAGVNYIGESMMTVGYKHPDSAAIGLLCKLTSTHYLHRELREKNGAYGGGCQHNRLSGVVSFLTYRDPPGYNRTIKSFASSRDWMQSIRTQISEAELNEGKLEMIKDMHAPIDAAAEGSMHFMSGLTFEDRNSYRTAITQVNLDDLERVAQKYFRNGVQRKFCVIGENLS